MSNFETRKAATIIVQVRIYKKIIRQRNKTVNTKKILQQILNLVVEATIASIIGKLVEEAYNRLKSKPNADEINHNN